MKKSLGATGVVTPLPVLIVGTYAPDGTPDAMNVAWGGQCGPRHIAINIAKGRKTYKNLVETQAFTVAYADAENVLPADYVGIISGNKAENKIAIAGWTARPGKEVNAPVFDQLPLTVECKVVEIEDTALGEWRIVGEIVNVQAEEKILNAQGKVSLEGWRPLVFDSAENLYRVVGEKVGNAFEDGRKLL